ncbi:hypothetical protein [Peribacillus butanolivorans]|uniref:hypothetical protein n=1 Tax=Peribacillus butanolivorans TaxID=421767 RepID=UPI003671A3CE
MYLYVQWIPKETRLIFISVKQETNRLQSTSSRKLCGLYMFLNLASLRWIRVLFFYRIIFASEPPLTSFFYYILII